MVNIVVGKKYLTASGWEADVISMSEITGSYRVKVINNGGNHFFVNYNQQGIPVGGVPSLVIVSELPDENEELNEEEEEYTTEFQSIPISPSIAIQGNNNYQTYTEQTHLGPQQQWDDAYPENTEPQASEKALSELSIHEQLAIAKYLLLGGKVGVKSKTGGSSLVYHAKHGALTLYPNYVYSKPEDDVEDFIDWSTIPSKFRYMVRFQDGSVYVFSEKPEWISFGGSEEGEWTIDHNDYEDYDEMEVSQFPSFEKGTKAPSESLVERPQWIK